MTALRRKSNGSDPHGVRPAPSPEAIPERKRRRPPGSVLFACTGFVAVLVAIGSGAQDQVSASEAHPQARFESARAALAVGDRERFLEQTRGLEGHALQAELLRAELQARIDQVDAPEVLAFIERYRDTAPGERIRKAWLDRLASEGRWKEYVASYRDDGSQARACWYRRALLGLGRAPEAFSGLADLYLTGRSLPNACDPLLAAWSDAGGLDADLVWARAERALLRGNPGVAAYQSRYLPPEQQPWLELMVAVHRRPSLLLEQPVTAEQVEDARRRQQILVHGVERLAMKSPDQARLLRASVLAAETLSVESSERIDSALGQALVGRGVPQGLDYLARIEPRSDNIELQQRRLSAALRLRAWSLLAEWAAALPPTGDPLGEWRYWRGRALLKTATTPQQRIEAAHAFASAAEERSLWGFASAELVGRSPAFEHRPVPADSDAVEALLESETARRIRALSEIGRQADIGREWREMTRVLPRQDRLAAAVAAAQLGLANEAILTLARAAYWDDLQLRFPLAHRPLVEAESALHGLPLDWLYAVIRQESAFDADIASHAGAIGLMQLMPATAREVAVKIGREPPARLELIDPALNIALGSAYLAEMQRRFAGHSLVASAAYNAGPNAVRRWLPEQPIAGDLWLSQIPYAETRTYARRVLTYRIIYRHRLGLPPLRVGALLRRVSSQSE